MKRITTALLIFVLLVSVFSYSVPAMAARDTKLVAITFDDGPSKYTEKLLDGLKQRGAKATFFMVGSNMPYFTDTIKRMKAEGHQLATHTMSHANLAKLSTSAIQKEVFGAEDKLAEIVGQQKFYLRPPYGSFNTTVKNTVRSPMIYWSVDTEDWRYKNAQNVANVIVSSTKDGDIILLHDLYPTSVEGALMAIDTLQSKGYVFVTVEQLLKRRGIVAENGKVYFDAPNEGINLPAVIPPVITTRETVLGTKVVIGKYEKDSVVHFTHNGETPDNKCDIYNTPYYIDKEQSIKAIAVGESEISDMVEKNALPDQKLSKEILDESFFCYQIPFLDKGIAFHPGIKL